MKITGFFITAHGDPTVGLFDREFRVEGDFHFDDQDEFNHFIIGMKELFEGIYDFGVTIQTFEERKQE